MAGAAKAGSVGGGVRIYDFEDKTGIERLGLRK